MLQEQHFNNPNLKTIGKKTGDEKAIGLCYFPNSD